MDPEITVVKSLMLSNGQQYTPPTGSITEVGMDGVLFTLPTTTHEGHNAVFYPWHAIASVATVVASPPVPPPPTDPHNKPAPTA